MHFKTLYCFLMIIAIPIVSNVIHAKSAKYLGSLIFGYTCYRVWGEDKPSANLYKIWFYMQPFLFGTVGAQLQFKLLTGNQIGKAFIIIICGLIARVLVAYAVSIDKRFNFKDRIFISITWIGKATV